MEQPVIFLSHRAPTLRLLCGGCRHWKGEPHPEWRVIGECDFHHNKIRAALPVQIEDGRAIFQTASDFGCIEFQEKS